MHHRASFLGWASRSGIFKQAPVCRRRARHARACCAVGLSLFIGAAPWKPGHWLRKPLCGFRTLFSAELRNNCRFEAPRERRRAQTESSLPTPEGKACREACAGTARLKGEATGEAKGEAMQHATPTPVFVCVLALLLHVPAGPVTNRLRTGWTARQAAVIHVVAKPELVASTLNL